jgi:tetratricopeptide (TPR) repeat protein
MADLTGRTLGKYQIIERLGRGGMADVYRAYQPGLDRLVAVKVMHSHLAEEAGFITRFQREAKAIARLRHPYIVQVIDFDVQDDVYYMVMEYIEGSTLKEWLRDLASRGERLPTHYALDIAAKLADALAYAHGEGMVHRDIKPANVLLRRPDHPVLSDFGIARIVGMTGLTAEGATIGTPAYMSPEQCRGETADERSDIYALGVVLFEMLAGHPPYDADTPYAVILKHINDPIPSPRQIVPDLPDAVELIILRSLAKDPGDRFTSAAALRDVLLTTRDELADITPPTRVTPPAGLRPTVVPASPTVAHEPAPTLPGEQAVTPPEVIPAAEAAPTMPGERAVTPPEMVAAEVTPTPPSVVEPVARKRGLAWPLLAVGALFVIGLIVGGALLMGPRLLGREAGVESGPAEVEPPAEGVEPPGPAEEPAEEGQGEAGYPEGVDGLLEAGYQARDEGDVDRAIASFSQALEIDPENMEALIARAGLYIEVGDAEHARQDIERAMELDPENPWLYIVIAHSHWFLEELHDPEAALNALNRAIELDPEFAPAYRERAKLYAWEFGDIQSALRDIDRAVELEPDDLGGFIDRAAIRRDSGNFMGAADDLAHAYEMSGEIGLLEERAAALVQGGDLQGAADTYGWIRQERPDDPYFRIGEGYVFYRKGELDKAQALVDEAVALGGADMPGLHYLIGLMRRDAGNPQGAIEEFEPLLGIDPQEYYFPFFTLEFGHSLETDLAQAYIGAGRFAEALELADRKAAETPEWVVPHYVRGLALARLGDVDMAREEFHIALDKTDDPFWRAVITEELERLG